MEGDVYHECVRAVEQVGAFVVNQVANAEKGSRASNP